MSSVDQSVYDNAYKYGMIREGVLGRLTNEELQAIIDRNTIPLVHSEGSLRGLLFLAIINWEITHRQEAK